jgi:hypothetical protein
MRTRKKLRANGSTRKVRRYGDRRTARKKRTATTPTHIDMPLGETPAAQGALSQATFFWPAFPIAMMRLWLGLRNTDLRK